jgi:hypothetical protein
MEKQTKFTTSLHKPPIQWLHVPEQKQVNKNLGLQISCKSFIPPSQWRMCTLQGRSLLWPVVWNSFPHTSPQPSIPASSHSPNTSVLSCPSSETINKKCPLSGTHVSLSLSALPALKNQLHSLFHQSTSLNTFQHKYNTNTEQLLKQDTRSTSITTTTKKMDKFDKVSTFC